MGKGTNPDVPNYVSEGVKAFVQSLDRSLHGHKPTDAADQWTTARVELGRQEFLIYHKDRRRKERQWPKLDVVLREHNVTLLASRATTALYQFNALQHRISGGIHSVDVLNDAWESFESLVAHFQDGKTFVPATIVWNVFSELPYHLHLSMTRVRGQAVRWSTSKCLALLESVSPVTPLVEVSPVKYAPSNTWLFATIALVRLDVMMGDYRGALKRAEALDVYGPLRSLLADMPEVSVVLFYHIAFAQMMLRRFTDALRALRVALSTVVDESETYTHRLWRELPSLIAVCCQLGGTSVDLQGVLSSKSHQAYRDALHSMDTVESVVERFCAMGMPYFLDAHHTRDSLQARMFRRMVQQLMPSYVLRTHAAHHSNTSITRVASLLHLTPSNALGTAITTKALVCELVHDGRSKALLSGKVEQTANVNFRIVGDTIAVIATHNRPPPAVQLLLKIATLGQ